MVSAKRTTFLPFSTRSLGDGGVGDDLQGRIDDERGGEDGLEGGLVPAGEGAAGVGGLELRGREPAPFAALILVLAAVEAAQLVVERRR